MSINKKSDSNKTSILIIAPYFHPAYKAGGPVRSLYNLINLLGSYYKFYIITGDRDLGDLSSFHDIQTDTWIDKGKYKCFYQSASHRGLLRTLKIINETHTDIIYLNSFFSYQYSIKILLLIRLGFIKGKKIVMAPRGELAINALKLKSSKKQFFLLLSKFFGVHKRIRWHITSDIEYKELMSLGMDFSNHCYAKNIPTFFDGELQVLKKVRNKIRAVFLSRVTPKKNLLFALEVLQSVKVNVSYDIYGPIEDRGYWNVCKQKIDELPENITVTYKGSISPVDIFDTLSGYHMFFFPTLSENFGHVIAEALSSGCILLLSTETPWRNLESKRIGWDIELDDKITFANKIEEVGAMDNSTFQEYRNRCFKSAKEDNNIDIYLNSYKKLFENY